MNLAQVSPRPPSPAGASRPGTPGAHPIRHRIEKRVRAHLFLCVLAYYVEWHLRQALAPLLFQDENLDDAIAAATPSPPPALARPSGAKRPAAPPPRRTAPAQLLHLAGPPRHPAAAPRPFPTPPPSTATPNPRPSRPAPWNSSARSQSTSPARRHFSLCDQRVSSLPRAELPVRTLSANVEMIPAESALRMRLLSVSAM